MAWSGYPVIANEQYAVWSFIRQTYYALQERNRGLGNCIWPRANRQWESGTVPSGITETSLTDSSKSGHWSATNTCPPWTDDGNGAGGTICTGATGPTSYQGPISWRLIIDDPNGESVVETDITSWTGSGTLNFHNIRDYVTSGQIPSIASLAGKTYYIIKIGGIWWSDRLMEWPNAYEFAEGIVRSLTASTTSPTTFPASPTTSLIRDTKVNWKVNEHVGRDLLVYGNDGFLKRVTIASNTRNTLHFATQTWTPAVGSGYCVVVAGGRAYPSRRPTYPLAWYRGWVDTFASHDVMDTMSPGNITGAGMPVGFTCVPGHICSDTPCACRDEYVWDNDFWTDFPVDDDDIGCRIPDECYTPDYWKTIRALQGEVESLSYAYVEASAMSSGSSGAITYLGGADIFRVNGINTYGGTTGDVQGAVGNDGSSNNQIAVTLSDTTGLTFPAQVSISIHRGNGHRTQGRGLLVNATTLLGEVTTQSCGGVAQLNFTQASETSVCSGPTAKTILVPGDSGATVYVSTGWTAFSPKEFKRMFRVDGVFIGDVITSDSGSVVQDPAQPNWTPDPDNPTSHSCYGVGKYVKRAASTHFVEHRRQVNDYSTAQGFSDEGDAYTYAAYQIGDIGRYGGDDFYAPTVTTGGNNYIDLSSGGDITAPYWDRFFTGDSLNPRNQYFRHRQLHGTTEEGGTFFLRDKYKNWFDFQWFGGTMRVDTGTATSGSGTSLTDDTKVDPDPTSPSVEGHCYWQMSRFIGFSGSYVGFTIEIDHPEMIDGDTVIVTYKRLIVSGNETTVTVTWNEPLVDGQGHSFNALGLVYRIKEPYYLNRWIDRKLIITDLDGNEYTTTVIGNSDDTVFFTPVNDDDGNPVVVGKDWKYVVKDPCTGTVWRWDGTKWQVLTGDDAARIGVPATPEKFHTNSAENLPSIVIRNGRYVLGDYLGPHIFNELYDTINSLVTTSTSSGSWTAKSSATATPSLNVMAPFIDPGIGAGCNCGDSDDAAYWRGYVESAWACTTPYTSYAGGPPCPDPSTAEGIVPYSFSGQNNGPTECYADAEAAFSFWKFSINSCGLSFQADFYNYGQIDASDSLPSSVCCQGVPLTELAHDDASDPIAGGEYWWCDSFDFLSDCGHTYPAPGPTDCTQEVSSFVANHSPVGYHVWTQWGSKSGTTGDIYSPQLGNIEFPEWGSVSNFWACAETLDAGRYEQHTWGSVATNNSGWYCGGVVVLLHWDVPGGFTYVAP